MGSYWGHMNSYWFRDGQVGPSCLSAARLHYLSLKIGHDTLNSRNWKTKSRKKRQMENLSKVQLAVCLCTGKKINEWVSDKDRHFVICLYNWNKKRKKAFLSPHMVWHICADHLAGLIWMNSSSLTVGCSALLYLRRPGFLFLVKTTGL